MKVISYRHVQYSRLLGFMSPNLENAQIYNKEPATNWKQAEASKQEARRQEARSNKASDNSSAHTNTRHFYCSPVKYLT